jgi:hypothetical protein
VSWRSACYAGPLLLVGPEGRVRFDVASDEGPARQVAAEAHRRFRADLRDRAERKRQAHAAQLAIYETEAQWALIHELQAALPGATVTR